MEANVFFLFIVMGIFPEFSVIGENLVTNMYTCVMQVKFMLQM